MIEKTDSIQLSLSYNLEDYKLDARDCVGCAGCRWVDFIYMPGWDFAWRCPPWLKYRFDDYGACGKLQIIHDLFAGGTDFNSPSLARVAYSCMLCGACDAGCKRNLDLEPEAALEALRVRLVEKGKGPLPEHKPITKNILNCNNRFGVDQSKRLTWVPQDIKLSKAAGLLYFAGCRASFGRNQIASSTARLIAASGTAFMVMKDEPCCGNYLVTTGQIDAAREMALRNIDRIKAAGAKKVVFSCAECYKTFKVDYPKLLNIATSELPFEVVHSSEVLDKWIREGGLKFTEPVNMTVTYHDSCNLGRLSEPWLPWNGERRDWGVVEPPRKVRRGAQGVYEPPRNVLKAIPGLKLVEMPRHHENAWCCGNAGGVKEAFPDLAVWTAAERLREAKYVGAEAIVAACPGCRDNFYEATGTDKAGLKVFDFHEFITKALKS